MSKIYPLCDFSELPENAARGFTLETEEGPLDIFIVRKAEQVYGYVNSCPHMRVNLNWKPDEFHDYTGQYLQCTFHGATFRIEDGYCIQGPCAGQSLKALNVKNESGKLSLELGL